MIFYYFLTKFVSGKPDVSADDLKGFQEISNYLQTTTYLNESNPIFREKLVHTLSQECQKYELEQVDVHQESQELKI